MAAETVAEEMAENNVTEEVAETEIVTMKVAETEKVVRGLWSRGRAKIAQNV